MTELAVWINHLLTAFLVLVGGAFSLLAAVGLLRMPDVYTRMQAATKAGTLGVGCLVLAVATHFFVLDVVLESLLVIAMLFVTAPVASHLIARAAYFVDVPLWKGTAHDEMRGCYDADTHVLHACESQRLSANANPDKAEDATEADRPFGATSQRRRSQAAG